MPSAITALMQQDVKRLPSDMEMVLAPHIQPTPTINPRYDIHRFWAAAKLLTEMQTTS